MSGHDTSGGVGFTWSLVKLSVWIVFQWVFFFSGDFCMCLCVCDPHSNKISHVNVFGNDRSSSIVTIMIMITTTY